MIIRKIEIYSDLSKEQIIDKIKNISRNNYVKYVDIDHNELYFRMIGQMSLLKYTPSLRVSGTIIGSGKCTKIKFKLYPYWGFWIMLALAAISAIPMTLSFVNVRRILFAPLLVWLLIIVLPIIDLLGQLEICEAKIKRAFKNN